MSNESVKMESVEQFVRKLGHDWRNALNSIDLHMSAVHQSPDPAEREEEIKLAHALVQHTARQISLVSRRISRPHLQFFSYPPDYFPEDLQARLANHLGVDAKRFAWEISPGESGLEVDFEALAGAVVEIFTNALQFNPKEDVFQVLCFQDQGRQVLVLVEKKTADPLPAEWGGAALYSSLRGHYGLGIFHARQVIEAHHGQIDFLYDPTAQTLRTEIRLPLSQS